MQRVGGREPMDGELGRFYDAIENPRKTRNELPILRGDELRAYMDEVRERTLDVLDGDRARATADDPLLDDGFVYEMLLAHEHQHNETMLQLLQMVDGYEPVARRRLGRRPSRSPTGPEMVAVDGGDATRSAPPPRASPTTTSARATRSSSTPFEIDRTPVTNAAFAEFVADTGAEPPMYWERDGDGGWVSDDLRAPRAARPGAARWSTSTGTRPTPSPAGRASACRPSSSGRRPPPAPTASAPTSTISASAARPPAPTATPPPTAARCRCSATSGSGRRRTSPATPASRPFPYPEYSEVFFGDGYKVLRGGAWATRRDVIRTELSQLGPARALTDLLRHPLRKGRVMARPRPRADRDRGPPARGRAARRPGRGRPRGALLPVQGAAAEVLLRRARLGAVRGDHRAARVLPDPRRALDPRRARAPRSSPRPAPTTLIELGSGAAAKTRCLLDAMRDAGTLETYVPVDISEEITRRVADELVAEYDGPARARGRLRLRDPPRARPARGGRR